MRLPLLALAVLLAGCAGDPLPLEPIDPVLYEGELPPGPPPPTMRWSTLAEGSATIGPASPLQAPVTVPNGTLAVLANVTLEGGAMRGMLITLGECRWHRDVVLVMGQEFAADCGGLGEGDATLLLALDQGTILAEWRVVALSCTPAGSQCPPRPPVTHDAA